MKKKFRKNAFCLFVNGLNSLEKKFFFRAIEDATGASERNIRLWIAGDFAPTGFRRRKIDEIAIAMGKDPIFNLNIELEAETESTLKVQLDPFSRYSPPSIGNRPSGEENHEKMAVVASDDSNHINADNDL